MYECTGMCAQVCKHASGTCLGEGMCEYVACVCIGMCVCMGIRVHCAQMSVHVCICVCTYIYTCIHRLLMPVHFTPPLFGVHLLRRC